MAFWGCEFLFDGVPCTQYGLMVYSFGSNRQSDVVFPSGDIVEERLASRYDAMTYGVSQNNPLEYTLVFGANMDSIDAGASIDRFEVEAIASWLTGHQTRKWLTIVQPDTEIFRYKCFITDLQLITDGEYPWAFSCKVNCDSPFAYTFPDKYEYAVNGKLDVRFWNRSSYNGFFRPVIEITPKDGGDFSILNKTDKNRLFAFSGLPRTGGHVITVDNKNQIITSSAGIDLYPYFNMHFLRFVRGDNYLTFSGNASVRFVCEFPVSVGG